MPLFEMTADAIRPLVRTRFETEGISERAQIQRLLCHAIDVLGDDLLVVAEEVSVWEDSKRRIDILAVDRDANLVVVELKRTEDGGHMELQAVRYAAMVSALPFEEVARLHADHRSKNGLAGDATEVLLSFFGWESPSADDFAPDVRIVLEWMPLDGQKACRIRSRISVGGHRSPEDRWPDIHDAMVDAMCRLEHAIVPRIR